MQVSSTWKIVSWFTEIRLSLHLTSASIFTPKFRLYFTLDFRLCITSKFCLILVLEMVKQSI